MCVTIHSILSTSKWAIFKLRSLKPRRRLVSLRFSLFRTFNPWYLQSILVRRISTTEFRCEISCHRNDSIYKWVGSDCEYLHPGSEFIQLNIKENADRRSRYPPNNTTGSSRFALKKGRRPHARRGVLLRGVISGHDPRSCKTTFAREIHGLTVTSCSGVRPCCSFRQVVTLFANNFPNISTFWVGHVSIAVIILWLRRTRPFVLWLIRDK